MVLDCCHTVEIGFARNRFCHVDKLWMIWLLYNVLYYIMYLIFSGGFN